MKITLNISKLLIEGKISEEEHDRLIELSKKETKVHAYAIFMVLAFIAITIGTLSMFPEFFKSIGELLIQLFGSHGLHLILIFIFGAGSILTGSGFLAALCAFGILSFLGDSGIYYSHASYFVGIKEPALTLIIFSVMALLIFIISSKFGQRTQRVMIIFCRTCIFIVNIAFWIGSLWGSRFFSSEISDLVFSVGWAVALILFGGWAVAKNRLWVVNVVAVFLSIHFYTQWFERLGASPGSLVLAGIIALIIMYGLREYNRNRLHS